MNNQTHADTCPHGLGKTRWYVCRGHDKGVVFQAGSGQLDSVANSCPLCGGFSAEFTGCACTYSAHPLDRSARPGRRVIRRELVEPGLQA